MSRLILLTMLASILLQPSLDAQGGGAPPQVQQVVVGPNVNMAGGPASYDPLRDPALIGDPFLQRQNEPSVALSSRNPCHLLAGANDYRAVDLEEALEIETADAWLGVFKSFDCGNTWTSTLLPGHAADDSPAGRASPLKDESGIPLHAGADPTIRAGTNGLFYYTGIAFNRGPENSVGRVFVARFIDNNNVDGSDPIKYLDTMAIDRGTSGQFLDKPWIAADVPRAGAGTCTVDGQTFAAGNVYLAYSAFLGSGNNPRTKILFSRSTDCGRTWGNPAMLSERFARNQGTAIAVDPGTGAVYVVWREFALAGDSSTIDAILVTRSIDGGRTWTRADRIEPPHPISGVRYRLDPFDQPATPTTFRTLMFPTLTIVPAVADGRPADHPGRVYVAWAARGFAPLRNGQSRGDSRIVISSSLDGVVWSYPVTADDYPGAGHQIIPALTFAGGKLALAYYDLRENAAALHEDFIVEYGETNWRHCMEYAATLSPWYPGYLSCVISTRTALRRHTLDLRAGIAGSACLSGGTCAFTSYAVSHPFQVSSAQVSSYVSWAPPGGEPRQVQFNRPNLQLFRKGTYPFVGDYIDLAAQTFLPDGQGGWVWNTGFTPGRPASVFHAVWSDNRDVKRPGDFNWENFTPRVPGPLTQGAVCSPEQAGIRNQNVYSAQLRPGLVLSAPINAKRVSDLQRSFVVVARNSTPETKTYRLSLLPPPGLAASFDQFRGFGTGVAVLEIAATIPPHSSASRTVFVGVPPGGSAATALVPVTIETLAPCAPGEACEGIETDTVLLNAGFGAPDFESAELHSPDFESPDFESPDFESPDFESFVLNTSIQTPDFESPDFESATITDLTWPVHNTGNTTSAYKANVYVDLPSDPAIRYQLVVHRIFPSPVAACAPGGPPPAAGQHQILVNIVDPDVKANLRDRGFTSPDRTNATFHLAPGDEAKVTLRVYCEPHVPCPIADQLTATQSVGLGVIAQAANCTLCSGPQCSEDDLVHGATECVLDDDLPPKDIYDPVPPSVVAPSAPPEAADVDATNDEPLSFVVEATDNVVVTNVVCSWNGAPLTLVSQVGSTYAWSGVFPVGISDVSCTAFDLAQPPREPNTASVTFQVAVRDVTGPVFDKGTVVPDVVEATGAAGAQVPYTTPTATDSAGGAVTVTCTPASGAVFSLGVTSVSCTATDAAGNIAATSFDVTVLDTTAPELTLPSFVTASATSPAGAAVAYVAAAVDVVDPAPVVTCTPAPGATFAIGDTAVSCTAVDGSGNTASGTLTVRVVDAAAPAVLDASATPSLLWPPDGRLVSVAVRGSASDGESGAARLVWRVIDEYRIHQPSGELTLPANGPFAFDVALVADRRGNDKDGRHYSIQITVYDRAGNSRAMAQPPVVNVHDRSGS